MKAGFSVLLLSAMLAMGSVEAIAQTPTGLPGEGAIAQSPELTDKAREFIALLAEGDYSNALAQYDPRARETIDPVSLENNWKDLVAQFGSFQGILSTETSSGDDGEVVMVMTEFERETVKLLVIFDLEGDLQSFDYFQ